MRLVTIMAVVWWPFGAPTIPVPGFELTLAAVSAPWIIRTPGRLSTPPSPTPACPPTTYLSQPKPSQRPPPPSSPSSPSQSREKMVKMFRAMSWMFSPLLPSSSSGQLFILESALLQLSAVHLLTRLKDLDGLFKIWKTAFIDVFTQMDDIAILSV